MPTNKAKRIFKHLTRAPWDRCAHAAFDRLPTADTNGLEKPTLVKVTLAADRKAKFLSLTAMKSNGYSLSA